jgi:hypothetical protein
LFYHRFLAENRLSRLGKDVFTTASFALRAALRDHARAAPRMVTEEDLNAFEMEFKETLARS